MTHQPPLIPDSETPAASSRKIDRAAYTERLRQHLQDPEFRAIEGFPIGEDEATLVAAILALSDPPHTTPLAPTPSCPKFWNNGRPSVPNCAGNWACPTTPTTTAVPNPRYPISRSTTANPLPAMSVRGKVGPSVTEVTALFHLLARYVVNTDPTSIIEELMPVAVPVYGTFPSGDGGEPLGRAATQRLLRATPTAETRTGSEVREALVDALGSGTLERQFGDVVERRREDLAAERHAMKEQMLGREGAQAADWLQGIDDLSPGSYDLLTITILFP